MPTPNDPVVTDPALIREAMADTVQHNTGLTPDGEWNDAANAEQWEAERAYAEQPPAAVTVYRCTRHGLQPAKLDPKTHKPKVRAFRTGFVARFLQCGCSIPVSQHAEQ